MPKRFLLFIVLFIVGIPGDAEERTSPDYAGIYLVQSASYNDKNCDIEGVPYKYNSKYFKVGARDHALSVNNCRGESPGDAACQTQYSATQIKSVQGKRQGYHYAARSRRKKDGTIQCILHASRSRIIPAGTGRVRYERSDWMEVVTDFVDECNTDMAKTYSESQSLNCKAHIVVHGRRIQSDETP